jgi:hypothetical protein
MKYLKPYELFESIDAKPFDESIFQELMDDASCNFIPLPEGSDSRYFCIEITDCEDETMVSSR